MGERFIVTGAAGFIASMVCEALLAAGHTVTGLDNLSRTADYRLKLFRLNLLSANKHFAFHQIDLTDWSELESCLSQNDGGGQQAYAAVFHLAARAGVRPSIENPRDYIECNVNGTLNILNLCQRRSIPKLIVASSSSVYGMLPFSPWQEELPINRPLCPYAASKVAAEACAYSYHHLFGLDISVARYFTVYGPACRTDMAIMRFIQSIDCNESVAVFGDGQQCRDFTYVDDIATGTILAQRMVGFEEFNFGNGQPIAVLEIIEKLAKLLGRTPKIVRHERHRADAPSTWACVDKARQVLNWSPRVGIDEGLERTVTWYRQHRELLLHHARFGQPTAG